MTYRPDKASYSTTQPCIQATAAGVWQSVFMLPLKLSHHCVQSFVMLLGGRLLNVISRLFIHCELIYGLNKRKEDYKVENSCSLQKGEKEREKERCRKHPAKYSLQSGNFQHRPPPTRFA
jgi:hypothetical protein